MICTKCGAKIPDDSAFCQICGNPVGDSGHKKIIDGELKNTENNEKTDGAVNTVPPAQDVNQDQAQSTAQANNVNPPQGYASNQGPQGQFTKQGPQGQQGQFAKPQMPYYQSAPQMGGGSVPVKKPFPKKALIIAIIAAAAVIALVLFINLKPTVVSLNKYLTITTTGYDSVGKASTIFNSEQFERDYSGKIKAKKAFADYLRQDTDSIFSLNSASADLMAIGFLEDQISGSLDKTSKLSNGDEIKYIWECNDAVIEKLFKVKLNYSDITYTVENLKPVEKKDVFADISLSFSGIAPTGRFIHQW